MWYYNRVSIVLIIIPFAGRIKNATLYAEKNGSGSRSHIFFII